MLIQGSVGAPAANSSPGTNPTMRQGGQGELIVQELHGRFYEQAYRNSLFSFGMGTTALVSQNAIATGVAAAAQPVLGVYNPSSSTVNLVMLKCILKCFPNNLTSGAAPSGWTWLVSTAQSAISTGSNPWNAKTMGQAGSAAKAFAVSTALTGMVGNLTVYGGADFDTFGALTYTTLGSTALAISAGGAHEFEGSIIVPPGGVLALMNQASSTTFSVTGRILWEEVPI